MVLALGKLGPAENAALRGAVDAHQASICLLHLSASVASKTGDTVRLKVALAAARASIPPFGLILVSSEVFKLLGAAVEGPVEGPVEGSVEGSVVRKVESALAVDWEEVRGAVSEVWGGLKLLRLTGSGSGLGQHGKEISCVLLATPDMDLKTQVCLCISIFSSGFSRFLFKVNPVE